MAENSYYNLYALRQPTMVRRYWDQDMSKILSRLRGLENYANQASSSWYGTDPITGVHYRSMALSNFPHLRIDYSGAPYRVYVRDRVDQLRALIGVSEFPWKHTPNKEDFDNANSRCGIDARALVEMMEAIGRPWGKSASPIRWYMIHTKETDLSTGKMTETVTGPSGARAGYSLSQKFETLDGSGTGPDYKWSHNQTKYARWSWVLGPPSAIDSFEIGNLEVGEDEFTPYGTIIEESSVYSHTTDNNTYGEYDWVELEGGSRVLLIDNGGATSEEEESSEAEYFYSASWKATGFYSNYGAHSIVGGPMGGITHPASEHSLDEGEKYGDTDSHAFVPEFKIEEDGSVTPIVPTGIPVGDLTSDNDLLKNMRDAVKGFLDQYGGNVTVDEVMKTHDRETHGGDWGYVDAAGGDANINTNGSVVVNRSISTLYNREQSVVSGGVNWLIWLEPYIPIGNGGWTVNLKA